MNITYTFEIYDFEYTDDPTVFSVVRRTTNYNWGMYDKGEDGLLIYEQDFVERNTITGDENKFILEKNKDSAKFVEKNIKSRSKVLSQKGRDDKLEKQLHYLSLVKSDLISWFLDKDAKYPINLDNRPAFILAEGNSSATLNGNNYLLSVHQGAIIKILYDAYLNDTPKLISSDIIVFANDILSESGEGDSIESDKMSDIFKSNDAALNALIVKEGQSHYRLNLN
jgi:hypothetical protein